jgi:sporulation protein YlmC with PRC-barrel domain
MIDDVGARTPAPAAAAALSGSAPTHDGARIVGSSQRRSQRNDQDAPGPELMAASSFEGEPVVNLQGETLGEIEDIMLDVRSGRIAYIVLSVGGLLGIGEKYFAIPWHALALDTDRKCFVLDADKERLKNAPGFDKERWPDVAPEWA